ncbi:MAG: 4Fe-4S binding protein, partial [Chloroflexi bacterium]|nr:4Fe-4S binding protein [Chloroflexota bacterium]
MVTPSRINLLERLPLLKTILKSRAFQPVFMLITLFVFVLAILTGLVGTPAGSRNFNIIFVWIVWWALLIIVMVPFFGRLWCAICPIPAPGEWLQRRSIVQRRAGKLFTLNRRWPRRLKNMWLQNFGFLGVAMFSTIILTRPSVSAWVLFSFLLVGVVLSAVYKNRIFCRYVCPVGGFIGLYSMLSPVELRVEDQGICASHTTKDCITGNENGYGCPWMVFPGNLTRNTYCGLCVECLKTCPKNNIVINLRPFGSDLMVAKERRLDEAYKAFIMLGCALLYSVVLLGPWGWLKNWANMDTLPHWAIYAAGFVTINLLALPGLFGLVTFLSQKLSGQAVPLRRLFVDYAYTLVPLGLSGWIAFSLGFVLVNGSYALAVISDPFGWG